MTDTDVDEMIDTSVDTETTEEELSTVSVDVSPAQVLFDPEQFAAYFLYILDKQKKLHLFKYNDAQRDFMTTRSGKDLILKARQLGFSTMVQGEIFRRAVTETTTAMVMSHDDATTQKLRRIQERFYNNCVLPGGIKPARKYSNATLVSYPEFDSTVTIATAGSKDVGRGDTYSIFHGCLSPDTMIMTPSHQITRMGDMHVNDEIITHTGAISYITYISHKSKPANTVAFRGMHTLPFIVTDTHKVWTQDGMRELSTLLPGDCIGYPITKITKTNERYFFRLPDTLRPQGGVVKEVGPDILDVNYNIGRILGFYLAEGCVKRSLYNEPINIVLSVHEDEVALVCQWLDELKSLYRSYKIYPRSNSKCVSICIGGKSFAQFVLNLCGELDNKHVPIGAFNNGIEYAKGLIHGYLLGDGCFSVSDRKITAGSVRSAITFSMRDLIASVGYGFASISHKDAGVYESKNSIRNGKELWMLHLYHPNTAQLFTDVGYNTEVRGNNRTEFRSPAIKDGYAWIPIDSIESCGIVDVMDFEVASNNHSYCTIYGAVSNSEVAFWSDAEKILAGAMQGGNPDVILESTPNGASGWFYERCMEAAAGGSEWKLHFYPWWFDPEYKSTLGVDEVLDYDDEELYLIDLHKLSPEQIKWRRSKKKVLKKLFIQEYPEDPETCFIISGESYFGNLANSFASPLNQKYNPLHKYGAGLDWGRENDFTDLFIIDLTTCKQVALLHLNKLPWGVIRKRVADTCKLWHIRTVIAESNSIGSVNIEELKKLGIAVHPFNTSNTSKADIMSDLYDAFHERNLQLLPIPEIKHQFESFVSTKLASGVWRIAAAGKGHDDIVIAAGLAWFARKYARVQIWP